MGKEWQFYFRNRKESLKKFFGVFPPHQGIYDFRGVGVEGKYETGVIKNKNLNVHLNTTL